MEQHPVPQNVTSFQFRLIGDMTIKQFGYLAGGAILAFISFKLPLPFFFTWPLTVLFGFLGVGFAFIPIEERPMDVWVLSFLRSVYSPTQYVWHRIPAASEPTVKTVVQPAAPNQPPVTQTIKTQPISTTNPSQPAPPTIPRPLADAVKGLYENRPQVIVQTQQKKLTLYDRLFGWVDALFPIPSAKPTQVAPVQQRSTPGTVVLPTAMPITPPMPQKEPVPPTPIQPPTTPLQPTPASQPAVETKHEPIPTLPRTQERPTGPVQPKTVADPTVKIFTPEGAARAGLPRLTTFTNVVTGIVKDHEGGLLPGVLVTVKDKEEIPLRALKTNKLGQFAASTQLPDGVYVIEVEDPRGRFIFDRAQITLNGTVLPAIGITAKSKREIDRENLAKQIFGQTTNT